VLLGQCIADVHENLSFVISRLSMPFSCFEMVFTDILEYGPMLTENLALKCFFRNRLKNSSVYAFFS